MQIPAPEAARIAWHTITAELSIGMLTLAFASTVIKLLGSWIKAGNPIWRGLVWLAEPTAYLAAIGGLLSLITSILTGFTYTWPLEVLLTSSVVLNKIAVSAFSVTFWALFVLVRSLYGAGLWERARLKGLYVALAVGSFLTLMLIGSIGGHLVGKRSMLDGILHQLGIKTRLIFVLTPSLIFALLAFTGAALILALSLRLVTRHRRTRAEAQACDLTKP